MKKRLILNTVFSLLLQITTIVCGFVLPRIILEYYGSEINGLVQSITQFLGLISFMELGVGAVIQSALYKPLADHDNEKISKVVFSGNRFFKRIALILIVYVAVLICIYPFISNQDFDWLFTATLIGAMSISFFAQYYFGITDALLLNANQKGYIQYILQIGTLILNTVLCYFLIKYGGSIQIVKLVTSLVFLIRPIIIRAYVNRKYRIDRRIKLDDEPIKQKWDGVSQHVATIITEGTDNVVLTTCSTLSNVSIYSVYHNVIYGMKNLFISTTNGFQSVIGDYFAKDDKARFDKSFEMMELLIHTLTSCLFACTGMLIIPFIRVYTYGITDVNYIQPLFGILIVCAHGLNCLRLPYHIVIKACGHYKQTQICYIIPAILNVTISIITVFFFGLIGVAIGTLVAMLVQTILMVVYDSKHLIRFSFLRMTKLLVTDLLIVFGIIVSTFWINMASISYLSWFILALKVFGISIVVTLIVVLIMFRKQTIDIFNFVFRKIRRQK